MNRRVLTVFALAIAAGASQSCSGPDTRGQQHATGDTSAVEVQRGKASWYGGKLHGGPTASGERFNKNAMTAAHRELPFNTRVRVINLQNDRSVEVRINDRGPFRRKERIIDLSEAAARKLRMISAGVVPIRLEVLEVGDGKRVRKRR